MKILVVDNYDSFVYNLVHILHQADGVEIEVRKNDKISIEEVGMYDKILLSPGPGVPKDAGMMPEIIKVFSGTKSIFGVCLGHQAIAEAFGGSLYNLPNPLHGVDSVMEVVKEDLLFKGLPSRIKIGHYHSWVVENQLPDSLEALAFDGQKKIMALRHREFDVRGVQFHPESVLTEYGKEMVFNWLGE
jgi:anthranilate synthase component II